MGARRQWEDEQKGCHASHSTATPPRRWRSKASAAGRKTTESPWHHGGDGMAARALQHSPAGTTSRFPLSIFWLTRSPLPAAGRLEGMNHGGRADPAHPSFSPRKVSPSPANGAVLLQLALPRPSHRMPATCPGKVCAGSQGWE